MKNQKSSASDGFTPHHVLICIAAILVLTPVMAVAQVNSGSNGSDGAFNPTTNTVINMADHPDGIYHYTSVNIPSGVTVTFIPNANNTPVVWLVQSNCMIAVNAFLDITGVRSQDGIGRSGGPGGYRGGNGGSNPSNGHGPGGGAAGVGFGHCGSYGTVGSSCSTGTNGASPVYGNEFLIPLLGGSGGGGAANSLGGSGGGGAILIATSGTIYLDGVINANGGGRHAGTFGGGVDGAAGSGGAVRLIATSVRGSGAINVAGGVAECAYAARVFGGQGRVRIDSPELNFGGTITGVSSQGYQPIILQTNGQGAQLTITSVGGVPVSASPTGQLVSPDAIISAVQNNPIPVVVACSDIPLNTQITVTVKPANGTPVSATGQNNTGTLTSSTATILINMPRGGGVIYATAAN